MPCRSSSSALVVLAPRVCAGDRKGESDSVVGIVVDDDDENGGADRASRRRQSRQVEGLPSCVGAMMNLLVFLELIIKYKTPYPTRLARLR